MADSYRQTPIIGFVKGADSEAKDKKWWHKAYRRACNMAIAAGHGDERMPHYRELSQVWGFHKDGKHRFDAEQHPELMRK